MVTSIHGRSDVIVLLTDLKDLFDLRRSIVTQTKSLKSARFVCLVDTLQSLFERCVYVRTVHIEDVDLSTVSDSKLLQTLLCSVPDIL